MRLNPFLVPILLLVALFGTVFTAQAMGKWSTSGRDAVDLTKMSPADIKGWMTLQQVMEGLNISESELYAIGNIPAETPLTQPLKDLEMVIQISTLRDRLTAAPGTSSSTKDASPAPASVNPTPTVSAVSTAAHATPTASAAGTATHATPTPLPAGQILAADQIKGKMTLREVSEQCAVPLDNVLASLHLTEINADTAIKDLIAAGKLVDVTDAQKIVASLQGN